MPPRPIPPAAVLFDLDGTLVDSAPDLILAAERLCIELDEPPPNGERVRRVVSAGGKAILRQVLPNADEDRIDSLLARYLDIYAQDIVVETRPYDGIEPLLHWLEMRRIPWGVVTNKAGWLAQPILEKMGYATRSAAMVAGDTLPTRKPDPEPVRHACAMIGVDPARTMMVGDDRRDIDSGRGAGAWTIAAAWGYLDGGDPQSWGADEIFDTAAKLQRALEAR
ncbi:MAG: HAD-IA family hydrolase [Dokdonella sp.]